MVHENEVVRSSWSRFFYKLLHISSLLFVLVLGNSAFVQSATVSGVVYSQDGTTRITNTTIQVGAYAGDPCQTFTHLINGVFNATDGTYSVEVPPSANITYGLMIH